MPSSEPTQFIPYKHIALVIFLSFIALMLWLYTPTADSLAPETRAPETRQTPKNSLNPENSLAKASTEIPQELRLATNQDQPALQADNTTPNQAEAPTFPREHKVVVRSGDVLSVLFDTYNLGQTALRHILSADESLLALETIRPGQTLYFRYKENTRYLEEMELYKRLGHRVIYRRTADNAFEYENIIEEGEWRSERISGTIEGIFYLSAQRAGLTETETVTVSRIFQDQLDFARAIRKGDQFQVIRSVEYIDDQPTGQTRIDSARIQRRAHEHTAFLFQDGRYYDKHGKSLARAFTRTPLSRNYRISSPFNPRRKHPVTGRVGPHNGTDFATPTGTRVLSTGDGVVARVGNHPFAGRYVDIQHGGQYKTRYLHLKRVLVRRGESISRGQVIALSGNSGRSTGPHLHFELHVNGRPVDPMKAKIPITKSITKKHRHLFAKTVAEQTQRLETRPLVGTEIATNRYE